MAYNKTVMFFFQKPENYYRQDFVRKIRAEKSDEDRDWESNFYICQKTKCAAVLTENFFYDNEDDVKYILSEEGRKAVIKTHANGIINYVNDIY